MAAAGGLPGAVNMSDPADVFPARLLSSLLERSRGLCAVRVASDGIIAAANPALALALGRPGESLSGTPVASLLTDADAATLRACLVAGRRGPILLNWVGPSQQPVTLDCVLEPEGEGFVLVGERAHPEEQALSARLLELNNQLAVLNRDNVRKSRELARTLAELREARVALVQSEKMASLGVMAAGIAHEVNSPVAFVRSNHETLGRDFEDLLSFASLVGDHLADLAAASPTAREALRRKAAEVDLAHLARAVPAKLASNIEGLDRVTQLVRDLRAYSRVDEAAIKMADLAAGIEATLRFLGPLLRERDVSVVLRRGPCDPLMCSPAAINQVFANVLSNAVQASPPRSTVEVETGGDADAATVTIRDHGVGIPPADLQRVFDPFFTTKPVGQGTGLGLSIAQRVVHEHGGQIEIESAPGEGTTVRVSLPRRGPLAAAGGAGRSPVACEPPPREEDR